MEAYIPIHTLQEELLDKCSEYNLLLSTPQWMHRSEFLIGEQILKDEYKSELVNPLLMAMKKRRTEEFFRAIVELTIFNYYVTHGQVKTIIGFEDMIVIIETLTFIIMEEQLLL